jgi:hypothetical protein
LFSGATAELQVEIDTGEDGDDARVVDDRFDGIDSVVATSAVELDGVELVDDQQRGVVADHDLGGLADQDLVRFTLAVGHGEEVQDRGRYSLGGRAGEHLDEDHGYAPVVPEAGVAATCTRLDLLGELKEGRGLPYVGGSGKHANALAAEQFCGRLVPQSES